MNPSTNGEQKPKKLKYIGWLIFAVIAPPLAFFVDAKSVYDFFFPTESAEILREGLEKLACPTTHELEQFVNGQLLPDEKKNLAQEHLLQCAHCKLKIGKFRKEN